MPGKKGIKINEDGVDVLFKSGDHGVVENSSGKMSVVRSRMRTSVQNLTAINGQLNGSVKRSMHY